MPLGGQYRLLKRDGYRLLVVPLSLWPALTGIISDNQYQFEPSCWDEMVTEVLSMPCRLLPDTITWADSDTWTALTTIIVDTPAVPEGVKGRVVYATLNHNSSDTVNLRIQACTSSYCMTVFADDAVTGASFPHVYQFDIAQKPGDYIRFRITPKAQPGTYYLSLWQERWTI
jgi:hypothetical protein